MRFLQVVFWNKFLSNQKWVNIWFFSSFLINMCQNKSIIVGIQAQKSKFAICVSSRYVFFSRYLNWEIKKYSIYVWKICRIYQSMAIKMVIDCSKIWPKSKILGFAILIYFFPSPQQVTPGHGRKLHTAQIHPPGNYRHSLGASPSFWALSVDLHCHFGREHRADGLGLGVPQPPHPHVFLPRPLFPGWRLLFHRHLSQNAHGPVIWR